MSEDNRKRPCLYRFLPEVNGLIRAYATKHKLTPNEAGETLINKTAAEIVEAARQIKRLSDAAIDMNGERNDYEAAAKRCAAEAESAREATRRADAEVERITADWRAALAETERVKALALERAGTDATEIKRLREQYEAVLDAVPSAAESRADQATIIALRSELAEVRAALETKGAAALPDDFEAKIAERAPGWKGTLPELRARVITLGFSRYDALATDAAKRAAERGR